MQGLKPSILIGKLKQSLLHGVSPDNDLFLAMFLIRLPPTMREAVGSGNPKTAGVMVKDADTLWDARGSHNPTIAATTTHCSRSPTPVGGKRGSGAHSKSHPPSTQDFYSFQNPGNGVCKNHNYCDLRDQCASPCTWLEN
jgi:hypothetical protein